MTHGQEERAERTVDEIEERVKREGGTIEDVDDAQAIELKSTGSIPFRVIARVLLKDYPKRTLVGATMMITQSFLYNAIFFTYALVLQNFYGLDASTTQLYFFRSPSAT